MSTQLLRSLAWSGLLAMWAAVSLHAQDDDGFAFEQVSSADEAPLHLSQAGAEQETSGTSARESSSLHATFERYGYREVSDFYNIREANPQVDKGEWEFEFESRWFTRSGQQDEVGLAQTLKYGLTDDLFAEIEVVESDLGNGANQGNGDIVLILFNRFVRETEALPALAAFVEARIPSGDGSSGVDAALFGLVTKGITDRIRVHFESFIETANGAPGSDEEDRRHFQWGLGPGFDYLIDDQTLVLLNYLNRASEEYGGHNENLLEIGGVREIYDAGDVHQHVKFAVDIGLDGQEETPHLGAKLQWSIDWK
jgi:hypothetical protein